VTRRVQGGFRSECFLVTQYTHRVPLEDTCVPKTHVCLLHFRCPEAGVKVSSGPRVVR
jgi:hypothetical protein